MGKKKIEQSEEPSSNGQKPVSAASMFGLKDAPLGSVAPSTSKSESPLPELVVTGQEVVASSPTTGAPVYDPAPIENQKQKERREYLESIDTGQSKFSSGMSELNRGLLGVGAAIPESIAILAKKYEDAFGGNKPLEDYQTYKWAKSIDKWIKDTYPTNPKLQDELVTQLMSGAGQAASFLAGGELSSGLKLSRGASMAYMGSAQNAVPEYEASKQLAQDANSLSPEQFVSKYATDESDIPRRLNQYEQLKGKNPDDVAWDAFKYNAVIGTTEAIPFDIALSKFDKITGGNIRKYFINAIEQGSTEAFQEVSNQYMSNLAAKDVYDKQREVIDGLKDAAVPSFILGSILGGFGSSIANRINDPNTPWQDKVELIAAKDEIDAQIKELPEDQDEIISKPIENKKIKDLTLKRDALEKELTTNKELSDETKTMLVSQSQALDEEIDAEKEIAVKDGLNQSRIDSDISALEARKASLEEERSKMSPDAQWAQDAIIDNVNSKLSELKQQQNVESGQVKEAGEEAVRLLEEKQLIPTENEEKGKKEGLLIQETGAKEVAPVLTPQPASNINDVDFGKIMKDNFDSNEIDRLKNNVNEINIESYLRRMEKNGTIKIDC